MIYSFFLGGGLGEGGGSDGMNFDGEHGLHAFLLNFVKETCSEKGILSYAVGEKECLLVVVVNVNNTSKGLGWVGGAITRKKSMLYRL